MSYVILVTALLLIQYTYFSIRVGIIRGKTDVKAPATSGHELFERHFRVQMNTLEQLVITIPALWICAIYFRTDVATILGFTFFIARFWYSLVYIINPTKRAPGMIIGFLANMGLIACCIFSAIREII